MMASFYYCGIGHSTGGVGGGWPGGTTMETHSTEIGGRWVQDVRTSTGKMYVFPKQRLRLRGSYLASKQLPL